MLVDCKLSHILVVDVWLSLVDKFLQCTFQIPCGLEIRDDAPLVVDEVELPSDTELIIRDNHLAIRLSDELHESGVRIVLKLASCLNERKDGIVCCSLKFFLEYVPSGLKLLSEYRVGISLLILYLHLIETLLHLCLIKLWPILAIEIESLGEYPIRQASDKDSVAIKLRRVECLVHIVRRVPEEVE